MSQKNNSIFEGTVYQVMNLIFSKPNYNFHLRKLAKNTGLSTTAITSAVKKLGKKNIITTEKTELTLNIKANISSEEYRHYKRVFNLYQLEHYGLIKLLRKNLNPKTIVLFGSYAKGEDIEGSDIDLFILTNQKKQLKLEEYGKLLARRINLHILQSLDDTSTEFKNSLANGIILEGYLKVI